MHDPIADRPRDLLVSGHVNVDRFLRLPRFPTHDRTVPVEAHRVELGGTAANIALTAAKYGVAAGLVSRVGDDFPATFWTRLRRSHVDLRGVERVRAVPTPTAYILEDRRAHQRTLMDQGPMADGVGTPVRYPWLGEYSWLHLTTGPPDQQLRLLEAGAKRGVRVAADPAQEVRYRWDRARLRRLLLGSEVLFGNRAEIDHIVRSLGARRPPELLAWVPLVVRTEGRRGTSAWDRGGAVHVDGQRPRSIRTVVGAGDAFRGGFYAAWFEGEDLRGCLRAGNRAAARWLEGVR